MRTHVGGISVNASTAIPSMAVICLTARHTSQTVIMQLFKLVMLPMEIHCL